MQRWLWLVISLASAQWVCAQETEQVRFADVQPLLERYCVECHSGWFPDGGLRLNSLENVRKGGRSGPAVVPGKPDKGWLINLVKPMGKQPSKMPPGPAQLSAEEIALLERWIEQGAR